MGTPGVVGSRGGAGGGVEVGAGGFVSVGDLPLHYIVKVFLT